MTKFLYKLASYNKNIKCADERDEGTVRRNARTGIKTMKKPFKENQLKIYS